MTETKSRGKSMILCETTAWVIYTVKTNFCPPLVNQGQQCLLCTHCTLPVCHSDHPHQTTGFAMLIFNACIELKFLTPTWLSILKDCYLSQGNIIFKIAFLSVCPSECLSVCLLAGLLLIKNTTGWMLMKK